MTKRGQVQEQASEDAVSDSLVRIKVAVAQAAETCHGAQLRLARMRAERAWRRVA